jgi:hypothetical protein
MLRCLWVTASKSFERAKWNLQIPPEISSQNPQLAGSSWNFSITFESDFEVSEE